MRKSRYQPCRQHGSSAGQAKQYSNRTHVSDAVYLLGVVGGVGVVQMEVSQGFGRDGTERVERGRQGGRLEGRGGD
jgi:hypothetical protein